MDLSKYLRRKNRMPPFSISAPSSPTGISIVTVNWSAAASSCLDTIGTHDLTLTFSSATPNGLVVYMNYVTGTGTHQFQDEYGADWRVRDAQKQDATVLALLIPPGVTSHTVHIDINENHDASETYILTILPGAYYTVGATLTHTVTCTTGVAMPDASNTGYGATVLTPSGGLELNDNDQAIGLEISSSVKVHGFNTLTDLCWIKGGGQEYAFYSHSSWTFGGGVLRRTKLGRSDTAPNSSTSWRGAGCFNFQGRVEECHFAGGNADAIKPRSNLIVERSFVEKLYDDPNYGNDSHCDGSQAHDGGTNFQLIDSNIFMPYPGSPSAPPGAWYESNFLVFWDHLKYHDSLVRGCWLTGGNATVRLGKIDSGPNEHTGIRVHNNQFSIYNKYFADAPDLTRIIEILVSKEIGSWHVEGSGNKWMDGPLAGKPITQINNTKVWAA